MDRNTLAEKGHAVTQAERELVEAHLGLNLEEIDRLLHKDYKIIQPGGDIETKLMYWIHLTREDGDGRQRNWISLQCAFMVM